MLGRTFTLLGAALTGLGLLELAACGTGGVSDTSACSGGLHFDQSPVAVGAVQSASPVGGFSPPFHVLPTDHGGIYLNATGVSIVAPAAARLKAVTRQRYLHSTFRQGQTDYYLELGLCGGYTLRLGHLLTVTSAIESQVGNDCITYSPAQETVEACSNESASGTFVAGEQLGTAGGPTSPGFDIGLSDANHRNTYTNPVRMGSNQSAIHAVCPYDPFPAADRGFVLSVINVGGVMANGESPQCGAMEVDQTGTAKGIWVLQTSPQASAGPDESLFLVLANHPAMPGSRQIFSVGPASLIPPVPSSSTQPYFKESSGVVNRSFAEVGPDGTMYCYVSDPAASAIHSYFLRLGSNGVLTLERKTHGAGMTPCTASPTTWSFSSAAVNFIR